MGKAPHLRFNTDMRINILNKGLLKPIFFLPIALVVIYLYMTDPNRIVNGYKLSGNHRSDNTHIRKDDEIVVSHAVIDFDIVSNYIVGLRLPAQYLECENGSALRIVMNNSKEYFILNTEMNTLTNYTFEKSFNEELKKLSLIESVNLDYSKFESVWKYYSTRYCKIDFSQCRSLEYQEKYFDKESQIKAENWLPPEC